MQVPNSSELSAIAGQLGFSLSAEEATTYRQALTMIIATLAEIPDTGEQPPAREALRHPGHRPEPAQNPFNAYITRCSVKGSAAGLLSGVRAGLKDNISVAGVPMTLGSRFMEGYIPGIDATVVTRLLDAGAEIVGKLNMDGFSRIGPGAGTGIGEYGRCPNPYAPDHLSGGSSSGSAVAVACGEVDLAIGGDQGGSIRIPAAWCGIVGLKPTHGLIPHTGVSGIESSLDHVGPMARTASGIARALECIAGPDGYDSRQVGLPPPQGYREEMFGSLDSVRIGVLREGFGDAAEPDVEQAIRQTAAQFRRLGARVHEISIPSHLEGDRIVLALQVVGTDLFVRTRGGALLQGYYDTHFIEEFGRRLASRADLLPPTIKLCMLFGAVQGPEAFPHYARAQNLRLRLRREYDEAFREVDCLLMPTVPIKAPKYIPPQSDSEALQRTLLRKLARVVSRNAAQFDVTGHPALSFPCALSEGLPVGAQLVGPRFSEGMLLRAAFLYEQSIEWNRGIGPTPWDPGREIQQ